MPTTPENKAQKRLSQLQLPSVLLSAFPTSRRLASVGAHLRAEEASEELDKEEIYALCAARLPTPPLPPCAACLEAAGTASARLP